MLQDIVSRYIFSDMDIFKKIAALFIINASLWGCTDNKAPEYRSGVFLKDWLLLGPLPNCPACDATDYYHGDNCQGFYTDFLTAEGGERNAAPEVGDEVRVNDSISLKWVSYHSENTKVPLAQIMKPKDMVVAYGFTAVYSPAEQKAVLAVGSNDGIQVFFNGKKVHEFHGKNGRWLQPDNDYLVVDMKKGRNNLLVKVDQGTGDWGFAARFLDYDSLTTAIRKDTRKYAALKLVMLNDVLEANFGSSNKITVLNPGGKVTMELIHEKKGIISEQEVVPGDNVQFVLKGLPDGFYTVKATFPVPESEDVITEAKYYKGTLPRHPRAKRIRSDRTVTDANGKPFFPIGTYGAPPEEYDKLRDVGFNFVVGSVASLDEAQKAGLLVAVHINGHDIQAARDTILKYKDHPAVLCWMMYDEPGYNRADMMHIYDLYNAVYEADPVHPSYLVITNPKVYETFGRMCDVLAVDTYPIPNGIITDVGDNIALAYKQIAGDQPVWHCGQLFHWPEARYPTPQEHRFMTYITLIEGAKGMLWYTYKGYGHYLPEDAPDLWKAHTGILDELHELAPLFLSPGFGKNITTTDNNPDIRAIIKKGPTGTFLIAANRSKTKTCKAEFAPGSNWNGTVPVYHENRTVKVNNGKFTDAFEPLAVHIYKLGN